ncbi:MAG: DJ-1/PfpI family protein [Bacteroidetes bacterium]|nr:DJ-1/PfpI family protein [Bacteroidota bacterium]
MIKIAVQLAKGFEEIEAVSIIDILRRAEISVTVVSVTGELEVTGSHNITISADQLFEEVNFAEYDMIVLPGGIPGALNLKKHIGLQNQILDFHKNGKFLGAICAAPLVFGNLGILKNRSATCYPGFEDQLLGAEVTTNNVELSDKIVTGKGAGVAMEFALKIVEMFKGKVLADELAKKMIVKLGDADFNSH